MRQKIRNRSPLKQHPPDILKNTKSILSAIAILFVIFLVISISFQFQVFSSVTAEVEQELLGTGPGRFNSIVADDIDDDGRCEIVFGNYDGHIAILEYRDQDFNEEWESPVIGHRVWGVTVGDLLGDSTKEIVVGNGDGEIYIYNAKTHKRIWYTNTFNNEDLVRDVHGLLIHNLGSSDTRYLLVGTGYKNDLDLGTIYIFKAQGTQELIEVAKIEGVDNRLRGIGVGDVDGDSELELVFGSGVATGANPGKGYVRIYDVESVLNNNPTLEWKSDNLKGDCVALELADFTKDGIPDIVVGNGYRYQAGWVRILTYDQDKNDYVEHWKSPNIGPKPYGLAIDDIDGDNRLEIVVGNQPGYIYIYEQKGSSINQEWKSKLLGSDILGIDLFDVDNDGQIEIVAAQGGYVGKGDYTSGYSEPHIYIIDGKTHETEIIIGETSPIGFILMGLILILIILLLVGLNYYIRQKKKFKELTQPHHTGLHQKSTQRQGIFARFRSKSRGVG